MQSYATVPVLIDKSSNKNSAEVLSFVLGILVLSALAQIAIPLPWTPVPITGQTLGVSLIALNWGRKRAFFTMLGYLALGAIGLPIFALGKSGLSIGPTFGYLVGMLISALVVGYFADRENQMSFKKTFFTAFLGSFTVYFFGLIGLSFFVPKENLLIAGFIPFIPGDIVKNTISSYISWKSKSLINSNSI
jgi:biotin transport system substrate-specific component